MKFKLSLLLFLSVTVSISQEKKLIDQTTYDLWKSIQNTSLSNSGNWVSFEITSLAGDNELIVMSTGTNKDSTCFPRGKNATFLHNEKCIVFQVSPEFDSVRKLTLAKTPKDKMPKDSLFIFWPELDSTIKIPRIKSYQVSKDGNWIAYNSFDDNQPKCPKEQSKKEKKKNPCTQKPTSGTSLTLLNFATGQNRTIHGVSDFAITNAGNFFSYVSSTKGTKDTFAIYLLNLSSLKEELLLDGQYGVGSLSFDDTGNKLAFIASSDTNKVKNYALYLTESELFQCTKIVDSTTAGMPDGFNVSEFGKVYFSENSTLLYFGTNLIVKQVADDSLLDTEKAKVDVWSGFDPKIQPQQLLEKSREEKKNYTAVYHLSDHKMVQLATSAIPTIRINAKTSNDHAIGVDDAPYEKEYTWSYPWLSDYYLIDFQTGESTLLKEAIGFTTSLSPSGEYFIYYSGKDSSWYSVNVTSRIEYNVSKQTNDNFASDNNGNPALADDNGYFGWTLINGQEYFIVKAKYDCWALPAAKENQPVCVTDNIGKQNKISFSYRQFNTDSLYSKIENNVFVGVNDFDKSESIWAAEFDHNHFHLLQLFSTNHKIVQLTKAENSSTILLRRMSFTDYPDLELTDLKFTNIKKVSNVNAQQNEYNWGTVEMVNWKSYAGLNLRGLLYKPENFDTTKIYPMIVYFYEKYTDDIHNYYSPKPTASIIYPTEYVSNGYIIFIPDIEYTPGYPAKSAYDCIVSGTDYLTKKYTWIDSTRLGLQGQSWGGYQTAQLITMTNKYAAAMAGAPVTNMTSAYGGVRWGSGLSRMFQYERTQSRIGYTLWERPDLYIANSPIFGLTNVSTPLLIMSNDDDGAVPWYQGIEMYMGLRRLNQPVWLLNYNGDQHNLTDLANKRDLSIRMRQFFDYYLLGAPMPDWMKNGVPAIDKGKNYGLSTEN